MHGNGSSDAVYGLAVIGALVYYLRQATSVWTAVAGVFKAVFWPAILMYRLLDYLKL